MMFHGNQFRKLGAWYELLLSTVLRAFSKIIVWTSKTSERYACLGALAPLVGFNHRPCCFNTTTQPPPLHLSARKERLKRSQHPIK